MDYRRGSILKTRSGLALILALNPRELPAFLVKGSAVPNPCNPYLILPFDA
jgi:hypothetical protein